MKKLCFYFLIFITGLLTGCATLEVKTTFIDKDYHPDNIRNSNMILACRDKVQLNDFVKAYNTVYTDNQTFCKIMTDSLALKIQKNYPKSSVSIVNLDSLNHYLNEPNMFNFLFQDKIIQNKSNYLILINNTTIEKEITHQRFINNNTTGMKTTETTITYCTITFEIEIFDIIQNKKVHAFTVRDYKEHFLSTQKNSLISALNKTLGGLVKSLDVYIEDKKSKKS